MVWAGPFSQIVNRIARYLIILCMGYIHLPRTETQRDNHYGYRAWCPGRCWDKRINNGCLAIIMDKPPREESPVAGFCVWAYGWCFHLSSYGGSFIHNLCVYKSSLRLLIGWHLYSSQHSSLVWYWKVWRTSSTITTFATTNRPELVLDRVKGGWYIDQRPAVLLDVPTQVPGDCELRLSYWGLDVTVFFIARLYYSGLDYSSIHDKPSHDDVAIYLPITS